MSRYHHGCDGETETNCSKSGENQFPVLSLLYSPERGSGPLRCDCVAVRITDEEGTFGRHTEFSDRGEQRLRMRFSLLDGIPADDDIRRVRNAVGVQREATRVLAVERADADGKVGVGQLVQQRWSIRYARATPSESPSRDTSFRRRLPRRTERRFPWRSTGRSLSVETPTMNAVPCRTAEALRPGDISPSASAFRERDSRGGR